MDSFTKMALRLTVSSLRDYGYRKYLKLFDGRYRYYPKQKTVRKHSPSDSLSFNPNYALLCPEKFGIISVLCLYGFVVGRVKVALIYRIHKPVDRRFATGT